VISTGVTTTIRDFIKTAAAEIGLEITFSGNGADEKGYLASIDETTFTEKVGEKYLPALQQRLAAASTATATVVAIDSRYFRPTEVDLLIGDNTKARQKLGWEPEYNLQRLITEMIESDIQLMKKDGFLKRRGYLERGS
jgi:GDPmannose 4,6-dehydratase